MRPRPPVDLREGPTEGTRLRSRSPIVRHRLAGLLVEAKDWATQVLDGIGDSETECWDPGLRVENRSGCADWRAQARAILTKGSSLGSVGSHLADLMLASVGPLGDFTRLFCSTQPPPAVRPSARRRGEVLPIPLEAITTELEGVDPHNLDWVRATVMVLNYLYCGGGAKSMGVPIEPSLQENQRMAVRRLGENLRRLGLAEPVRIPSLEVVRAQMGPEGCSDYGRPLQCLDVLDAERVIAARPPVGSAGVVPIVELLSGNLSDVVRDPTGWWLPDDLKPQKRTRSDVMASDEAWFSICQAGHARNLMKVVSDDQLHKDREGHYITIGAGGVSMLIETGNQHFDAQWVHPYHVAQQ